MCGNSQKSWPQASLCAFHQRAGHRVASQASALVKTDPTPLSPCLDAQVQHHRDSSKDTVLYGVCQSAVSPALTSRSRAVPMTASLRHTNARAAALVSVRREATCWLTISAHGSMLSGPARSRRNTSSPGEHRCRRGRRQRERAGPSVQQQTEATNNIMVVKTTSPAAAVPARWRPRPPKAAHRAPRRLQHAHRLP